MHHKARKERRVFFDSVFLSKAKRNNLSSDQRERGREKARIDSCVKTDQ